MGIEVEDYRKAAKENGYITDSDEFSDDDIASGGFMALTSMRAMGEGKMQIYLGTDDEISDNTNIELAIDKELIAEDSLDKGFSDKEADSILDKFDDLYYGEFWPDNIEKVSYKENVSQLEYFDIKDYKEDDNIITLDDSAAGNLKRVTHLYSIIRAKRFQRKSVRIWVMAHFHWKTQRLKMSLIL